MTKCIRNSKPMKNNFKILWCLAIVFLNISISYGQGKCMLNDFADDLQQIESFLADRGNVAWHLLYKAEVSKEIRQNISDLTIVDDYLNTSKKSIDDVIDEIEVKGGFEKWKFNNAGGKIGKYDLSLVKDYFKHIQVLF